MHQDWHPDAQIRLMRKFKFALLVLLCASCGCTGSRWARSDPTYAAKYKHHSDNLLQMSKQASDARFIEGRSGVYAGADYGNSPGTAGGSIGFLTFPQSWFELRGGLMGLAGTGDEDLFGGVDIGARMHSPSRLSPFAGIGGQIAYNEKDLRYDNLDNDDDGLFDEPDEEDISSYYAAVLPEAGVHFWVTPRIRLTASGRYSISSSGRDDDQWLFGLSFSFLNAPDTDWEDVECDEFKEGYVVSEAAKRNIDLIHAEISAEHNPEIASRVVDMVYDDFDTISQRPHLGRESTGGLYRFANDGGPTIEYRKVGNGVEIAAVIQRRSRL